MNSSTDSNDTTNSGIPVQSDKEHPVAEPHEVSDIQRENESQDKLVESNNANEGNLSENFETNPSSNQQLMANNQEHDDNENNPQNGLIPQENENEIPNNEDQEESEQQNNQPSESSMIAGISNAHLMTEEGIGALRDILCSKENIFYQLTMKDNKLYEHLNNILKFKTKIAENTIGEALSYYHQKLIDSELGHLDKLMKILKSKKRDMYLRKIPLEELQQEEEEDAERGFSESMAALAVNHIAQDGESPFIQKEFLDFFSQKSQAAMKRLLPEYNPKHRYIRFQLNDRYEVFLKVCEEEVSHKKPSLIDRIPNDVLQNHLFIYFNSFDLFKLRAVCSEWRDLIRGMWHIIFKREMMEQVIAADLCNDIEMNFKLMSIKTPFYHKVGILMKAIIELIEWENLLPKLLDENLDIRIKFLVITFLKFIGVDVKIDKLSDFQEEHWNQVRELAASQLRTLADSVFEQEFHFSSSKELDLIKENFLDYPDISGHNIRQLGDKNLTFFQLFLHQLLLFAQLKNYLGLAQNYVIYAKDKLKEVSKEWAQKKGFLEGAYKILLFKFVQIKDGEVTIAKDEEDEHKHGLLMDIQKELNQCISITNEIHQQDSEDLEKLSLDNFNNSTTQLHEDQSETKAISQTQAESNNILSLDHKINISQEEGKEKEEELVENEDKTNEIKDQDKQNEEDEAKDLLENLLNSQLSKIIELRRAKEGSSFQRFIKGEGADYSISKHGAETRLFLDDAIKIELLVQKFVKLHLLKHIHEKAQEFASQKESQNQGREDDSQNADLSTNEDKPTDLEFKSNSEQLGNKNNNNDIQPDQL